MAKLNAQTDIVVGSKASAPFLRFLQALQDAANGKASPDDIASLQESVRVIAEKLGSPDGSVSDIPAFTTQTPRLQALPPLFMNGDLRNGFAQIGIDEEGSSAGMTIPQAWVFA